MYDYRTKEDKIQRMQNRRALMWKMDEEYAEEQRTSAEKQGEQKNGTDGEDTPPEKSDIPKLYGSDTTQNAAAPEINDYKSYWYGYLTQRFTISPVDPVTAARFKNTEELDAVMYVASEKKPDVSATANPRKNLYNYYITGDFFYKREENMDKALADNEKLKPLAAPSPLIVPVKLKSGEVVWYKITYKIGSMKTDEVSAPELTVTFISEESATKTISGTEAKPVLKDENDKDIDTQLTQAFAGEEKSGMKPLFNGSFPVPKNKKQKEQLKKIVLNRQNTFFNINPNGIHIRNAIYKRLFEFYQDKKDNPSVPSENASGVAYHFGEIFQFNGDKILVSTVLIENQMKKKFGFQNIILKYVNNDSVIDTTNAPGREKDQTDAIIEAKEAQEGLRINVIFENGAPSEERPQVKAFVMSLIYVQNPLKNVDGSDQITLSAEDGYTNREFDQVIPIRLGSPPVIENIYYTIRIEQVESNNNYERQAGEPQKLFNIYIERIGKEGERGKATEDAYSLDIRRVEGYPGDTSLFALKTWVRNRYPALVTSQKIKLDYTSVAALINSVNIGLKVHITDAEIPEVIGFLNANYTITIHNDRSAIAPLLVAAGYNPPLSERARYTGEGEDRKRTDQEPDATNGVKIVEDETADIHAWKKEELLLFELSVQRLGTGLYKKTLKNKHFFRQIMYLRKAYFNKVAGITNGDLVAYYDSAFREINKNRFIGGKEQVFDYSQHTILHEIGHTVAHQKVTFAIPNRANPTVEDAFADFISRLTKEGMQSPAQPQSTQTTATANPTEPYEAPTDYGHKNVHEFYADSFMLYMLDPEFLITNKPELYWWFDFLQVHGTAPETVVMLRVLDSKRQTNTLRKRE